MQIETIIAIICSIALLAYAIQRLVLYHMNQVFSYFVHEGELESARSMFLKIIKLAPRSLGNNPTIYLASIDVELLNVPLPREHLVRFFTGLAMAAITNNSSSPQTELLLAGLAIQKEQLSQLHLRPQSCLTTLSSTIKAAQLQTTKAVEVGEAAGIGSLSQEDLETENGSQDDYSDSSSATGFIKGITSFESHIDKALSLSKNNWLLLAQAADMCVSSRKYYQANQYYLQALKAMPAKSKLDDNRCNIYYMLTKSSSESGESRKALDYINQWKKLETDPEQIAVISLAMSSEMKKLGMIAESVEYLHHVIIDDEQVVLPRIFQYHLQDLIFIKDYRGAQRIIELCKQRLLKSFSDSIDPDEAPADQEEKRKAGLIHVAAIEALYTCIVAVSLGNYDQAEQEIDSILSAEHYDIGYLLQAAHYQRAIGQTQKAIVYYERFIRFTPLKPKKFDPLNYLEPFARESLADLYFGEKRYHDALVIYQRILKEMPFYPQVSIKLARVWEKLGDQTQAQTLLQNTKKDLETILKTAPKQPCAHFLLAKIYCAHQDWISALAHNEITVKMWPGLQISWQQRGLILTKLGKNAEALEAFTKALNLLSPERMYRLPLLKAHISRLTKSLAPAESNQALDNTEPAE